MPVEFALLTKRTFLNALSSLPRNDQPLVLSKINALLADPSPDGALKRKLVSKRDVYRLRVGNYRVLYTYGNGYVTPLTVDDRKDVYRGDLLVLGEPPAPPYRVPDVADLAEATAAPPAIPASGDRAVPESPPLPRRIDEELLARLGVDPDQHPVLRACRTVDDLCTAPVPGAVRDQLFDAVMDPDLDRILEEPDLDAGNVEQLHRYVKGELAGFLLRLDAAQAAVVTRAIGGTGPVMVKGGPGSGKSTVALYRTRELVRTLRAQDIAEPRVLFTTYTTALVTFSQQLLEHLLGADAERVDVRNADKLVHEVVRSAERRLHLADASQERATLERLVNALDPARHGPAVPKLRSLGRSLLDYLLEEIGQVIEGREIATLDDYLAASRPGRRVPLGADQRRLVWELREDFNQALQGQGLTTWHQARRRALEIVRSGGWEQRYDAVVVDEAQDLDVVVLRLLAELCTASNRLFLAADANQSIYGSGFRWADVHGDLRFRGRTSVLGKNYRSTREIGEAAQIYLAAGALDDVDTRDYTRSGPAPRLYRSRSTDEEVRAIRAFIVGSARALRLGTASSAVLVPSEKAGQTIATQLSRSGVEARFMPGRDLDLDEPVVKVITLQSAKGLEFPVVAVAGFRHGGLPPDDLGEEALLRQRRTIFVAMTRAMRALLVVVPSDRRSSLLTGFDPSRWDTATS